MLTRQAIRHLSRRCQAGDPEAWHTLLHSVADGMYAAARATSATEAEALAAAEGAWRDLHQELAGGPAPRNLRLVLRRLLRARLAQAADSETARRALRQWSVSRSQPGAPPALLARLEAATQENLPALRLALRERGRRRGRLRWATVALAAAVACAAAIALWSVAQQQAAARSRLLALETLQARLGEQRLTWAVRDLLLDLGDPAGVDRQAARTLAQVHLALEELSASPSRLIMASLPSLRERLEAGQTLSHLREMTLEASGPEQATLAQATLALEEVGCL